MYRKLQGWISMRSMSIESKRLFAVWSGVFLYVVVAGLFVQKIFLPFLFPQAHWGHGLVAGGDWELFHREGIEIADFLRANGWQSREEAFSKTGQIMSEITGVIYALTGIYEPWTMLFYNGLLWATASVFFISLLIRLGFSFQSSLLACMPFVFFPSSLTWNAQIHRDGLYILGFLGLFYSVAVVFDRTKSNDYATALISGIAGIALIYFARNHMAQPLKYLFLTGVIVLFFVSAVFFIKSRKILYLDKAAVFSVFFVFSVYITQGHFITERENLAGEQAAEQIQAQKSIPWEQEWWVPKRLDASLYSVAEFRHGFIHLLYKDRRGNIDTDFVPERASDFIQYAPRALVLGFFSPFPDVWFSSGGTSGGTLARYITPLEMMILWPGVFTLAFAVLRFYRSPSFWTIFIICLVYIFLHVISEPNLGPVYRKRYVFIMLLTGINFASLYEFYLNRHKPLKMVAAPDAVPPGRIVGPEDSAMAPCCQADRSSGVRNMLTEK